LDLAHRIIGAARDLGLVHQIAEDAALGGRTLRLHDRDLIHFGSCSYLGLELDPRLIDGAVDGARRYGAHFSSSRSYISCPLYRDLEGTLGRLFGSPTLVTPTTTLGHLAALPTLCEAGDVLLIDRQAHASLHLASQLVRVQGATVEAVPHNRIDRLQRAIERHAPTARRIWYVGDGIYSMYGDCAPVAELCALCETYEQLHLYLDDAHGVSWTGHNGVGFVLDRIPKSTGLRERIIVALTLGKAFGAGGAALVTENREWLRRIQHCGGTMVFAGPVPSPVLGASLASARLHESGEITGLQARLRGRIQTCTEALLARGLPLVSVQPTPVRFLATGAPEVSQRVLTRAIDAGFLINPAVYPAVSRRRSGLRFTLTLHQTEEDVLALADFFSEELPAALAEANIEMEELRRRFHIQDRADPEDIAGTAFVEAPMAGPSEGESRQERREERAGMGDKRRGERRKARRRLSDRRRRSRRAVVS